MAPLSETDIANGLRDLAEHAIPDASGLSEIAQTADGSLRAALTLLAGDGLAIAQGTRKLAEAGSRMDLKALHALSDLVAARGQTDNWESFQHVAETWLHGQMRQSIAAGTGAAYAYVKLWEGTQKAIADSDALNLDRKQVVLDFFLNLRSVRT